MSQGEIVEEENVEMEEVEKEINLDKIINKKTIRKPNQFSTKGLLKRFILLNDNFFKVILSLKLYNYHEPKMVKNIY